MTPRAAARWRWGLSIAAAGVLCIGAASCFFQAYWIRTWGSGITTGVNLTRGAVFLVYEDIRGAGPRPTPHTEATCEFIRVGSRLMLEPRLVFPSGAGSSSFQARIPFWIPLAAFAFPAAWLWVRQRRRPRNACPACGYDLCGTRGERCPECGEASGP